MRRQAFTLIEVLVVIAIVAILAAILTPVLIRAKHESKKTTCISNMHQLALAGSIEDGRPAPALYCPLANDGDPSYYAAWDMSAEAYRALEEADPGRGIKVCYRHGEKLKSNQAAIYGPAGYRGVVLRLRADASVQRRDVQTVCYTSGGTELPYRPSWRLYSDLPCPAQYCRTDTHACPW